MVVTVDPELKEIEILRCGTFTASSGVTQGFTHEIAQEIVDTYSPDLFKAPLIVSHNTGGHKDRDIIHTELAFGTPKYLKKVGDRVAAVFEKISPQFVKWTRNHQILGISPSFYPPNHSSNPTPGKWHLRHIAGLGKNPPAIKGMKALSLQEFLDTDGPAAINFNEFNLEPDNEALTLNYSVSDREIANIFQRWRDHLIDKEGLEVAEKILSADYLQMLIERASMPDYRDEMLERLMMRMADRRAKINPPLTVVYSENHMTEEKDKTIDFAERERQLQSREASLVQQAQALAAKEAQLSRKEDLDFTEGLIKQGRALPHEKDKLVNFMGCLRSNDETVDFGENDTPSLLNGFKRILSERPPVIELREIAKPEDSKQAGSLNFSSPEGFEVDADALEIHEKALSYMESHKVDYLTAVKKVGG